MLQWMQGLDTPKYVGKLIVAKMSCNPLIDSVQFNVYIEERSNVPLRHYT